MKTIGLVYDDLFLEHRPPTGHPERPERLQSLMRHIDECGLRKKLHPLAPAPATINAVAEIHSTRHIEFVRRMCGRGGGVLDQGDTYVSPRSFDAALIAAGGVISAVDAILSRKVDAAFCAVRPPGHHAERDAPMGFCLFNNVAIGARYAQRQRGIHKVAVLDWDVHHGNGTQHAFEEDPSVLYISLHQYPFYPGTGGRNEKGIGRGEGFTKNIPFPPGTGEDEYLAAFGSEVVPALETYAPGLLIISAGFDAHRNDPLAGMNLTEESFGMMTRLVKDIAPIVSVLEGGYDLWALGHSVEKHLDALMEG